MRFLTDENFIAKDSIGKILDDLEILILCANPEDYENQVLFVPMP